MALRLLVGPKWNCQFNDSKFYQRFSNIVKKLNFSKISLKQNYDEAADLILTDRKHLDNNPKQVSKQDIISLLEKVQHEADVDCRQR